MDSRKMKEGYNKLLNEIKKEFKNDLVFGNFTMIDKDSARRSEICVEKQVYDNKIFKQMFKSGILKYNLQDLEIKAVAIRRQIVR